MADSESAPFGEGLKVWGRKEYAGADASRWFVIFPHYIDSKRKKVEGRRIASDKAVESPQAAEIFECVRKLGLRTQLELDKSYCKDCWIRGRVRVELLDPSGVPIQSELPNRNALFLKVANMVPQWRTETNAKKTQNKGSGSSSNAGSKGSAGVNAPKKTTKKKGKR